MAHDNGQEKDPLVKLGPLWVNEARNTGQVYLQGYLGDAKMLVLKNNYKEKDTHPDYFLYVARKPPKKEGEEQREPEAGPTGRFSAAARSQRDGAPLDSPYDDGAPPHTDADYNDAPEIS